MRGFLAAASLLLIAGNAFAQGLSGQVAGGSGSGTVTSITCDGGLTGGTITTTGTCELDLTHANTWAAIQTFGNGYLQLAGSSSGDSLIEAPATGGGIATLPAGSGTLVYSGGATASITVGTTAVAGGTHSNLLSEDSGGLLANIAIPVPLIDGGTNGSLTASNGGIFYSTASAGAILAGTATAGLPLLSGSSTTPAWGTDANLAYLDVNQSFTKGQAVTPFTISSCTGTVTPDASVANDFLCTLSGSITLANPTNLKAGQTLNFWFTQPSSAGPDTLTLGSEYQAAGGAATLVLSTANSTKDFMSCRSDTTTSLTCNLQLAIAH